MPDIALCFIKIGSWAHTPPAWLRSTFQNSPILCQSLCLTSVQGAGPLHHDHEDSQEASVSVLQMPQIQLKMAAHSMQSHFTYGGGATRGTCLPFCTQLSIRFLVVLHWKLLQEDVIMLNSAR